MKNIRLRLAYDGTAFAGWQGQPDQRTVQGELEAAVLKTTGETVRVLSAGRTDAGVHALGQVANFNTVATIPPERFRFALQQHLPVDIVLLESDEVPDEFHATYWAVAKRYRYLIRIADIEHVMLRRYAWRMEGPLDVEAMRAGAAHLLGTHDFRCFESNWPNKSTSVRTIHAATVTTQAAWSPWDTNVGNTTNEPTTAASEDAGTPDAFIAIEVEANGFLYNMVRAITGTLVKIGRREWPAERMQEIIAAQSRSEAGMTAPAHGLYMLRVVYTDPPRPTPRYGRDELET